ncbi:hypothetical protein BC628DRAFT_22060 [Trametes gibbosa]|nr:hypothetical protein BC628DRAFT_22060 [Trametes gibbosa]
MMPYNLMGIFICCALLNCTLVFFFLAVVTTPSCSTRHVMYELRLLELSPDSRHRSACIRSALSRQRFNVLRRLHPMIASFTLENVEKTTSFKPPWTTSSGERGRLRHAFSRTEESEVRLSKVTS